MIHDLHLSSTYIVLKINQHVKYLCQRSFRSKVIVWTTQTHKLGWLFCLVQ